MDREGVQELDLSVWMLGVPEEILDGIAVDVLRVFNELPYGRVASFPPAFLALGAAVYLGGDKTYWELGTLHGASAVLAALVKERFGLGGGVVAVDPMDGYYPGDVVTEKGDHLTAEKDPYGFPVTPDGFWRNTEYFGVADRVHLVCNYSEDADEPQGSIGTLYIDGNHYGEAPKNDFLKYGSYANYVVFDDANHNCPGVVRAVKYAIEHGWRMKSLVSGHLAVLERAGQ